MGAYGTATMTFSPVLMVLVLVASAQGGIGPSSNNSFCTESKECLEYQLVCKTDEYEVRHYSPTRWVSTDAEAYFMGVGAAMAFRRLFQYITGANEEGVQMEMTTPVLVKIPEETKMWEPAVYTLNFPLPAAYQERPPKPTSDKTQAAYVQYMNAWMTESKNKLQTIAPIEQQLYFTEMPDLDVYVRSYGGWMLSVTSRLHAHLLTKELERVRAPYNRTYHYGVGYDSPLKLTNRHNEVWYIAEGEPVCTDPQEPTPAHTPTPTRTALTDSPTVAAFAAALRALRDSPASPASHRASEAPPSDSAALPSGAPSASSSNPPTQSPSEAPRPAAFSLPFTAAQSAAEPSANSSVGPSPEPQTVSGPQNVTDFQAVTGLGAVTGPQSARAPHATITGAQIADSQNVSEPSAVTGPQNASDSQAAAATAAAAGLVNATGAQNDSEQQAVTGAQNVSELQTATGPQNVSDPQAVTAPQTAAGTQTYSELQNDSVPWNDTTQGDQEAQAGGGLVAERSDTQ